MYERGTADIPGSCCFEEWLKSAEVRNNLKVQQWKEQKFRLTLVSQKQYEIKD